MSRPAQTGLATGKARLPVPARDRRPALAALALLLVLVGALGAALVVYRSGQRTDVLVAAQDIKAGQQITAADFTTTRISSDSGGVISADAEGNFIGNYANTEIPSGTLVNHYMFQRGSVLPSDGVIVGVTVAQAGRPAVSISTGDVVRAYLVTKTAQGDTTGTTSTGTSIVDAARVVAVSSGSSSTETVSLLVTADVAPALIAAAAQSSVSLAELPSGTKPPIDYQRS